MGEVLGETVGPPVAPPRRVGRWLLGGLLLILMILGGSSAWRFAHRPAAEVPGIPAREPPDIPDPEVDPAVRRLVEQARAEVRESPASPAAWGQLGMVLGAHNFLAESRTSLAQAELLDPRDPRWPYLQGVILLREAPGEAMEEFRHAVACAGTDPLPRLRLAEALLERGQPEEAEKQFRAVLETDPDNPRAHLGLGRLTLDRGRLEESLTHLQKCASHPCSQKAAHVLLARLDLLRRDTQAVDREQRLLAQLPEDAHWPDPYTEAAAQLRVNKLERLARVSALAEQGRLPEAESLLHDLRLDFPEDPAVLILSGQTLVRAGKFPQAAALLAQASRLTPASFEAHYFHGLALLGEDQSQAAAECFQRALQLHPQSALAHYFLGVCSMQGGDRSATERELREAIRLDPNLAPAHRELGDLLAQQGHPAEARDQLQQALRLNPDDPITRQLLDPQTGGQKLQGSR
ncbi:MAG: tetratricopeptide repeat protein [Planctomycetes bacterium]|nr:tetratricopeptide repeat protein [Planctomycetota bacterium]